MSFDPRESDRPPRSEGYMEEVEKIYSYIDRRGDQRIGQYLINAVSQTEKYEKLINTGRFTDKEAVENILWNIEAPELLKAIEKMEERHT